MKTKTVLFLCASLLASGCIPHSYVNDHWGEAYQATHAAQAVDTGEPKESPEGIDPVTAELVSERYYRGQRTQETRRGPAILVGE